MRRSISALVACTAVALMVLCQTWSAAAACPDCLRAGAASATLRVPPETPLAGYGSIARRLPIPDILARHEHAFWFRPHVGERDQLMARAVALESASSRLIWVSLDVVAVDRAFTASVTQRLRAEGSPEATLIVSASHTHSGPGAFLDSAVMGFIAVDRHDEAVRDALVDSVVSVVRRANEAMQPARMGVASVTAPAITTGRLGRAVDPEVLVVKIVSPTGSPIALLWNYAIHGTMLGPRNLSFSGDVMGLASRLLEADLSIPVLFVNGAVADVSPRQHGYGGALATGRELAATVKKGWKQAGAHNGTALVIRKRAIRLTSPHLRLRNCLGRWVPRALTLPLASVFPQDAELIGARLGPVAAVAILGELQSALGQAVKRSAARHWRYTVIAGLSNDYLGYFVTTKDYDRPSYVTCANLYGAAAGDDLAHEASVLLDQLAADSAAADPTNGPNGGARKRNQGRRTSAEPEGVPPRTSTW